MRKELAISFEDGFPLMPAPLETGLPGKRALDSEEAGSWLRALLELSDHDVSERKVSSHSLKCTMLSFLAKRGVDMPDRLLLGYHTSPFTMGLTYSRDGMARPLQILGEMLSEIREGTYMPDCTRSGRLVKKADTGGGLAVSLESTQDATKIEISDDEGELNVWELIQTAARAEPAKALPEVIPENCETEINDACTETSSSDVSETEEADTSFEDTGRKTLNHQLHLKDSLCGSTQSPRSFTWSTTRPQAFSSAVASREPSIHVMASTQGGTVAFVGSALNIDDTCCS